MTPETGESLTLHEAARLNGAYCAIERRLFELTGALAVHLDAPPDMVLLLSASSAEHAWHAELWADRLPVVSGLDHVGLVALTPTLSEVFEELSERSVLAQLTGLFRVVLPRLVSSYARHEAVASPASEAPTRRALRLVLRDEREEWVAGEALVERLLDSSEAVQAAWKTGAGLEERLVGAGVGPGLLRWPGRRA